jgi:signal transduction histidine kinase/HAMP domain-containing protein
MKSRLIPHRLLTQMIAGFTSVILAASLVVGILAIWLVRDQLEQRAWSQLQQGRLVLLSLFKARVSEIQSLAVLTAQRPKLNELIQNGDLPSMENYLETLRSGAGIDLILLCEPQPLASASRDYPLPASLCERGNQPGIQPFAQDNVNEIWMLGSHALESTGHKNVLVIVGLRLDDEFADQLSEQIGMENTLWYAGMTIAKSHRENFLPTGVSQISSLVDTSGTVVKRSTYRLNGQPFYSEQFSLPDSNVTTEIALNVAGIYATQASLVRTLIGGILVALAIGSLLGLIFARRISRPLEELIVWANHFQNGDLTTPIQIRSSAMEITLVAQTLERTRAELLKTLTSLQQEQSWSNQLLESIVEGIVTFDAEGKIRFFSHGAERITGQKREDVIGKPCNDVFQLPVGGISFREAIPVPRSTQKLAVSLAGGPVTTLSITSARLSLAESRDDQTVLVFRDVSEEETVHRLLGQFLGNITHEFRTPLSALAALTELLLDQAPDLSPDELQELLASLHISVVSLQTLVDNLLESSSIEAGRFRVSPHPADLGKVIQDAAGIMQPLLEKYHQHLVIDMSPNLPMVLADSRRTMQVLNNLLSNASKFGLPDAKITVRTLVVQDMICVEVADQGPGIPPESSEHIFSRFAYTGANHDNARAGAGLGLSVVKAIVEAQGGTVGVGSNPDGGSTFWFTLPMVNER